MARIVTKTPGPRGFSLPWAPRDGACFARFNQASIKSRRCVPFFQLVQLEALSGDFLYLPEIVPLLAIDVGFGGVGVSLDGISDVAFFRIGDFAVRFVRNPEFRGTRTNFEANARKQ